MTREAPTLTADLLIELFKQVIKENTSRDRPKLATTVWRPETLLDETGFDSFDLVELIFKIEDQFGIDIDYNANNGINDVKTIGELCDEIGKIIVKKQAA